MSAEIEVTIGIDGKRITLKGPADFVQNEIRHLFRVLASKVQEEAPRSLETAPLPAGAEKTASEKDLIEQKRPKAQTETVAVMAFALALSGRSEFSEEDMRRAYIRAGVRPPQFVGQALRDARNKCDYITKGSKRGLYRLSAHGERTVRFDLPRPYAAPAVPPSAALFDLDQLGK